MKVGVGHPVVIVYHRAKCVEEKNGEFEAYLREAYIEFIEQLMQRMGMDGINEMLDAALKITK
jgi:hypothetical protein